MREEGETKTNNVKSKPGEGNRCVEIGNWIKLEINDDDTVFFFFLLFKHFI